MAFLHSSDVSIYLRGMHTLRRFSRHFFEGKLLVFLLLLNTRSSFGNGIFFFERGEIASKEQVLSS